MKKFFAVLLGLSVIFGISICAFALQENGAHTDNVKSIVTDSTVYINPAYDEFIDEKDLLNISDIKKPDAAVLSEGDYVNSTEAAGEVVREQLKARKNPVVVYYVTEECSKQTFVDIMNSAVAHTGEPDEGEYIEYNNVGWSGGYEGYYSNGNYYLTVTFAMTYCTTAEQEAQVDSAIESVMAELDLEGYSQYEKVCGIYDYICDNVVYDYKHYHDEDYLLQFSTYAALINKTAVCQGYATLFYRLALEYGIDTRLITGVETTSGDNHAWNIVRLGEDYYNVDSTWDAGTTKYGYFLKCDEHFDGHARHSQFATEEFYAEYEMASKCYEYYSGEKILASGWCGAEGDQGKNLEWEISSKGVLTVSGEGAMHDYSDGDMAPWYEYEYEIEELVLEEGITEIGTQAFYDCTAIDGSLTVPASVKTVGNRAFCGCGINEYYFEGDAPEVDGSSFDKDKDVIHYHSDASGWDVDENGDWNGFHTEKEVDAVASGYCGAENGGTNLSWILSDDGVLSITGEGKMYDYSGEGKAPWYEYKNQISSVVFSGGVTSIGDYAFSGCYGICESLVLPDGIEYIGTRAFYNCAGLTGDLVVPASVKTVGDYAFTAAYVVGGNLVIEEGVESIGDYAFSMCGFIGDLVLPNSLKTLGKHAFELCSDFDGELTIGSGLEVISEEAFDSCGFAGSLSIGKNVTVIGGGAFYNCANLCGSLSLPESVTEIGAMAFGGCGINEYYFSGNAPSVVSASESLPSFDASKDTIYYLKSTSGWVIESGKWNGFKAVAIGEEEEIVYGDINGDSKINIADANLARRCSAKLISLDDSQLAAADVNGDGKVNIADANLIRRYAAKIIKDFPVEG